jgi:hypothetical protein
LPEAFPFPEGLLLPDVLVLLGVVVVKVGAFCEASTVVVLGAAACVIVGSAAALGGGSAAGVDFGAQSDG